MCASSYITHTVSGDCKPCKIKEHDASYLEYDLILLPLPRQAQLVRKSPVICCEPEDTPFKESFISKAVLSDPLLPCLPCSSVLRLASSCAPALSLFSPSQLPFLASVFSCYCSHSLNSSFSNSLMPLSPSFTLFYNSLSLLIFSYTFPLHILSLRPSPSPCVPPLLCPLFHFPLSFLLVSLTFPLSLLLSPPSLRLSAPCLTALLVSCSLLAQWSSFFSVTFRFSFFFL